jgi:hypothetical protein
MSVGEISEAQKWCKEARKILGLSIGKGGMEKRSDAVVKQINELRQKLKEGGKQIESGDLTGFEKRYVAIAKRALKAYQNGDKEAVKVESEQLELLKLELKVFLESPERQKTAKQNADKQKVEVDKKINELLRGVNQEWQNEQQACVKALGDLQPLSSSEHLRLKNEYETLMLDMPTERTKEVYEEQIRKLSTLKGEVDEAVKSGKKASKEAAGKLKKASELVEECDEFCTLEQKRGIYDFFVLAEDAAKPGGDYIMAVDLCEQVIREAGQLKVSQENAKRTYEEHCRNLETPLEELAKVTSRAKFVEFSQVSVEAHFQSTLNNFEAANQLLGPLAGKIANAINEESRKLEDWKKYSQVVAPKIALKVDAMVQSEKNLAEKPWTWKYKAEVMAEVDDILWKAENLRSFDECKIALDKILNVRLASVDRDQDWDEESIPEGSIAQEIHEISKSQGEAIELAESLVERAESVGILVQQLVEKVRTSDPDKVDAVDHLQNQVNNIRFSVKSGGIYLQIDQMKVAVSEGLLTLASIEKSVKGFLSGSEEGTRGLQDMVAVQTRRKEFTDAELAWTTARDLADQKLAELGEHGGDEYFALLAIYEQAEIDAENAKCEFTKFLDELSLNPDSPKESLLVQAREVYKAATDAIGTAFLSRADTAINLAAGQLQEAKRLFAVAKSEYSKATPRTGILGKGTKLADAYINQLVTEAQGALAYEQSSNTSAIKSAAEILRRVAAELTKVAQDFGNDATVEGSFRNLDKQLKDLLLLIQTPALKQVDPTLQKSLRERWDKLKLGIVGKSNKEAIEMIARCRDRDVKPSVDNAVKILEIRGKTPALLNQVNQKVATLVQRVNTKANPKLPTTPPDLGTITSEITGCDNLIKSETRAGVVEAAYNRLVEIRDKRLDVADDQLKALGKSANAAIALTRQNEIDNAKKKEELTKEVEAFKKNELVAAKNFVKNSNGDDKQLKVLENGIKGIEQSLKSGELISVESQLAEMKNLHADVMNSGRAKKSKSLLPLGKSFSQKVDMVNQGLVALKEAVRQGFKDDPTTTGQELQSVLDAIPASLADRGILANAFDKPIAQLDNVSESLENHRAAREAILQTVRDYQRIVLNDPILVALRNNKFGVPIPSGPLYAQLRAIEDAVVIRT